MLPRKHRIIEIFRVFAIYGNEWDVTQIGAPLKISLADLFRKTVGFFLYRGRPDMGNIVTAHSYFYF